MKKLPLLGIFKERYPLNTVKSILTLLDNHVIIPEDYLSTPMPHQWAARLFSFFPLRS